jgi:hypothetical protein
MARHKAGDVRADGSIFNHYKTDGREHWLSPAAFHRKRICTAHGAARHRARKKKVPFDITIDYLADIYPKDGICPALRVPLSWGDADRNTSPSLDRIDPAKGYVVGNVRWLSQLANQIKTSATTAEICAVAEFLRKNDY